MDILELRMDYTAFVKLRNFVKINDISAEIKEYIKKNDVVSGKLNVSGTYLIDDLVLTKSFSEDIPFNIIFSNNDYEVIDIDCVNLDYQTVDGRGIEVLFDIVIKYEDYGTRETVVEVPVIVEEEPQVIETKLQDIMNNNEDYEAIKEEKEYKIDELITEKLNLVEDNEPSIENETTEVVIVNENEEKRSTIKICYYKDNNELDRVCNKQNVGIDKIFNDNKNTDFVKYRRVIIK